MPSTAEFTGYGGTDMQSLGYLELHTQNISTKKYHILRFHVLESRQPKDPCMSCSCTLDRFCQGAMCQQSTHKASRFPYS